MNHDHDYDGHSHDQSSLNALSTAANDADHFGPKTDAKKKERI